VARWVPATRFVALPLGEQSKHRVQRCAAQLVRGCPQRPARPPRLPIPPRRPPLLRCRRPWQYDAGPTDLYRNRRRNFSGCLQLGGILSLPKRIILLRMDASGCHPHALIAVQSAKLQCRVLERTPFCSIQCQIHAFRTMDVDWLPTLGRSWRQRTSDVPTIDNT